MKNLLPFFFTLFIISISFAQNDDAESQRKNTVFIESYKPVFTNSVKYYDDRQITFQNGESYTRDFNLYAIGMGFERVLKNKVVIRPRFGLTIIDLINGSKNAFSNSPEDTGNSETGFVYEQNYINLFLGLAKRIQLNKEFNIDFGIDLAVISYLEGTSDFYSNSFSRGPDFSYRTQEWSGVNYGKAISYGIGPILKPEYKFKTGLSISFEIQYYFLKTIVDSQIKEDYRQESIFTQTGIENTQEYEIMAETNIDFSEWSWSEFAPLIRLGYSF